MSTFDNDLAEMKLFNKQRLEQNEQRAAEWHAHNTEMMAIAKHRALQAPEGPQMLKAVFEALNAFDRRIAALEKALKQPKHMTLHRDHTGKLAGATLQ